MSKVDPHRALAGARFMALEALLRAIYVRLPETDRSIIKSELLAGYDAARISDKFGMDGDWVKHQILHVLESFFEIAQTEHEASARRD